MQFGLWFEPEMVNADSELYRAHPDWILATGDRAAAGRPATSWCSTSASPEVRAHVLEQIGAVLVGLPDRLRQVGPQPRRSPTPAPARVAGAPGVHDADRWASTRLLDELRPRTPSVEWESCASGGGRIDLGVIERVERFWTSDMTDALARQAIQRWTAQLVPPEYLGAHVAAPVNHQTGRTSAASTSGRRPRSSALRRRVGHHRGR